MIAAPPPAPAFCVYLITDPAGPRGPALVAAVEAVLDAVPPGSVAIQLRDRSATGDELAREAGALAGAVARRGALLFVNGLDPGRAAALGAAGVHCPDDPARLADWGRSRPDALWLGASCHDAAGLARAEAAGADLVVLGPVFPTPGKAAPGQEMGLARFASLARSCTLPVFALGGVTPRTAGACRGAGASGVAVVRWVWSSPEPAAALRALVGQASLR